MLPGLSLSINLWKVSEGRSPLTLIPSPATCAVGSEALLCKAFLTPFAARRVVGEQANGAILGGKGSLGVFRDTWAEHEADLIAENALEAVKAIIQ